MISLSQYQSMKSVPAGAILNSIITQQRQTKATVARTACILPQRLNDLITGARRFTVETSFKIAKALNISDAGFFYIHQAEHDIYLLKRDQQRRHRPDISKLTKTTFWDVKLEEVNWESGQRWAIRRVLEYGEPSEGAELCRFYGTEAFEAEVQNLSSFRFPEKVKSNWSIINNEQA